MRRRRLDEDRINHDRWLVSYADFITLLFAFFVVMYALSSLNESKYRAMSNSMVNAFGKLGTLNSQLDGNPDVSRSASKPALASKMDSDPSLKSVRDPDLTPSPKTSSTEQVLNQEKEKMKGLAQDIFTVLAPLIDEGKIRVSQTSRGILIDINDSVLFASGAAKLTAQSSQALEAIAKVMANDEHNIQVEGFTDNQPIKNGLFPSNWELSAIRAASVARLFIEHGIAEDRLTAIGQGPKIPVGDNDTVAGRSRNRRVNITILAVLPEKKTEVPIDVNKKVNTP